AACIAEHEVVNEPSERDVTAKQVGPQQAAILLNRMRALIDQPCVQKQLAVREHTAQAANGVLGTEQARAGPYDKQKHDDVLRSRKSNGLPEEDKNKPDEEYDNREDAARLHRIGQQDHVAPGNAKHQKPDKAETEFLAHRMAHDRVFQRKRRNRYRIHASTLL